MIAAEGIEQTGKAGGWIDACGRNWFAFPPRRVRVGVRSWEREGNAALLGCHGLEKAIDVANRLRSRSNLIENMERELRVDGLAVRDALVRLQAVAKPAVIIPVGVQRPHRRGASPIPKVVLEPPPFQKARVLVDKLLCSTQSGCFHHRTILPHPPRRIGAE